MPNALFQSFQHAIMQNSSPVQPNVEPHAVTLVGSALIIECHPLEVGIFICIQVVGAPHLGCLNYEAEDPGKLPFILKVFIADCQQSFLQSHAKHDPVVNVLCLTLDSLCQC